VSEVLWLFAGREAFEAVQRDMAAAQQASISQHHLLRPRRSELHAQSPLSHQVALAVSVGKLLLSAV